MDSLLSRLPAWISPRSRALAKQDSTIQLPPQKITVTNGHATVMAEKDPDTPVLHHSCSTPHKSGNWTFLSHCNGCGWSSWFPCQIWEVWNEPLCKNPQKRPTWAQPRSFGKNHDLFYKGEDIMPTWSYIEPSRTLEPSRTFLEFLRGCLVVEILSYVCIIYSFPFFWF